MTALEDVKSVEDFAATVVRRSIAKRMTEDEIQDAIAEGVTLLYELHEVWDPKRCESFYRFCTTYLQLRLIDWWRREARQRNLAHRNTANGGYTYHGRVSLDDQAGFMTDLEFGKAKIRTPKGERVPDRPLVTHDAHRLGGE